MLQFNSNIFFLILGTDLGDELTENKKLKTRHPLLCTLDSKLLRESDSFELRKLELRLQGTGGWLYFWLQAESVNAIVEILFGRTHCHLIFGLKISENDMYYGAKVSSE